MKKTNFLLGMVLAGYSLFAGATPNVERLQEVPITASNAIPESQYVLWYKKPSQNWMSSSLPIGNGQLGAMVFGGVHQEEIQFNEKTLCTGSPCINGQISESVRGAYQNFGSIFINNPSVKEATNYQRRLDIQNAVVRVNYTSDGVNFQREYLASHPDGVIAMHYTADQPGKISFNLFQEDAHGCTPVYSDGTVTVKGKLQTVSFSSYLKVIADGAEVNSSRTNGIEVKNANDVLIIMRAGTDYDPLSKTYVSNTENFDKDIKNQVDAVAEKSWKDIYDAHVKDFRSFFDRVEFKMTNDANNLPTPDMIKKYDADVQNGGAGSHLLEQLIFQFGRYLLISSSRGVPQPANLQGIWNHTNTPPWFSDIHANINVQMNYWPAEPTNLSEMHETFLDWNYNESTLQPQWRTNAYNAKRTIIGKLYGQAEANKVTPQNSRGWTLYTGNNIFGGGGTFMMNNVSANAWNCMHIWQHYRFTMDKDYLLKKAYPMMKSCCEFWLDRLINDRGHKKGGHVIKDYAPDGTLVAPLEYSPENGPGAEDGCAHAQQLCWDLFHNTLQAMEVLGDAVSKDAAFKKELETAFGKLDPGTHIDEDGYLREWKYSERTAGEKGHRHMSNFMGLYPGSQIAKSINKDIFNAAVKSLAARGDASTGWSLGWKINLWARALDGEHAFRMVKNLLKITYDTGKGSLKGGIYENLLDACPPFQIDGNFGITSGIAEMLLQSHTGTLNLLPAIPGSWDKGYVKGLCAVGGFEVGMTWKDRRITEATILSKQGQPCRVTNNYATGATVTDEGGQNVPSEFKDKIVSFKTIRGKSYTVHFTTEAVQPPVEVHFEYVFKDKVIGKYSGKYEIGSIIDQLPNFKINDFCESDFDRTIVEKDQQKVIVNVKWKGPFEISEKADSLSWYYLKVNSNNKIVGYLRPIAANKIACIHDLGEGPEYCWAFLGDPVHLKLVNKKMGSKYCLSGDGTYPTMKEGDFSWDIFVANASKGKFLLHDEKLGYTCVEKTIMEFSTRQVEGAHIVVEEVPVDTGSYNTLVLSEISPYFNSENLGKYFEITKEACEKYKDEVKAAEKSCGIMTYERLKKIVKNNIVLPKEGFYRLKNVGTNGYLFASSSKEKMLTNGVANTVETVLELRSELPPGTYYKEEHLFLLTQGKWCGAVTGATTVPPILDKKSNFVQFLPLLPGKVAFAIASYNGRPGYEHLLPKGYYTASQDGRLFGSDVTPNMTTTYALWTIEDAPDAELPLQTLGGEGYETLCLPYAFSVDNGTANTVSIKDGLGELIPMENPVPPATPVVVRSKDSKAIIRVCPSQVSNSAALNVLKGSCLAIDVLDNDLFLGEENGVPGFVKTGIQTLPCNRAYVPSTVANSLGVNKFLFNVGTGIESITFTTDKIVYDLQGRKVQNPKHGLYIIDNEKVFIK